ncbi:YdeI/OmpD-associated family protein [Vibrio ulleungensis]|uniref:YdeI/OmpD-associated family protein n=1 Tax=Vibrio ulleungensis TaxID=2807619 RepID=A0ABS2HDH2_9VIBR|nr:YdeI/OmpD-associated family protein [Vibrio ulleungensis]MBM7035640.1 YdeI/OmpD-associated family protein [Vibrio ulleungensis]
MPDVNSNLILPFETSKQLFSWLQENHATHTELWIRIYKKHSATSSIAWEEAVIELLRWGWIDGVKKSLDDHSYLQRVTPRKPGSNWSKRNRDIAQRLINEQTMTEFGLLQVNAAKADGRWENAYTASEMTVPNDFLSALTPFPQALDFYNSLTKSDRYVIAYGLTSAKRPETRARRFDKYMTQLKENRKPS